MTLNPVNNQGERLCGPVEWLVLAKVESENIQMYTYISVLVIVGASRGAEVEIRCNIRSQKNWMKAMTEV